MTGPADPVQAARAVDLDRADAYGLAFADVYDRWYDGVTDATATAAFVAERAVTGPVLELGVGSGRLARPLAARGLAVIGLDGSGQMLARCRTSVADDRDDRDDRGSISLVRSDMRALPFRGPFGAILIAFNTLFNLGDATEQGRLLIDLAAVLAPAAPLVIEAMDVSTLADAPNRSIGLSEVTDDGVVVSATRLDHDRQTVTGRHLEVTDRGVTARPWRLRWLTPPQLDDLAGHAGLTLIERHGSWTGHPFTASSDAHISVYHRR
ncbi:MAG: class I SAM-dependent methyltransferase [Actinomycetota bacterium]